MIGGGICFLVNSFFLFVSSLVYLHDVIVILFFLVMVNAPGILCHCWVVHSLLFGSRITIMSFCKCTQ